LNAKYLFDICKIAGSKKIQIYPPKKRTPAKFLVEGIRFYQYLVMPTFPKD